MTIMTPIYRCPECKNTDILVCENVSKFYLLDYAEPDNNYYESGEELSHSESLNNMNLVCNECNYTFPLQDLIVEDGEESDVDEDEDSRQYEEFSSKEEAAAFCMGVEIVNDSSLTAEGPYEKEGKWRVYLVELFS